MFRTFLKLPAATYLQGFQYHVYSCRISPLGGSTESITHTQSWYSRSLTSAAGGQLLSPACTALTSGQRLRIAVALSGGVDSAVSALLLKQQGHDVFGVFMKNWDAAEEDSKPGIREEQCYERDLKDARIVAQQLDIPLHEVDFVRQYWDKVFSGFVRDYQAGWTPNPDLACNRHIKFGCLLETAKNLGAQAVATGHYARVLPDPRDSSGNAVQLLRGVHQDQSYFLASLRQQALRHYIFPVGHMPKPAVRAAASAAGLLPAGKRSSRGICFIGPRDFAAFMAQYVQPVPGELVCVESGNTLATCPDMLALTAGQRVAIPGRSSSTRYFAVGKHMSRRVVFVAPGSDHPALLSRSVHVGAFTWIDHDLSVGMVSPWGMICGAKAAYNQLDLQSCTVRAVDEGVRNEVSRFHSPPPQEAQVIDHADEQVQHDTAWQGPHTIGNAAVVKFRVPVRGLSPGQALVLYDGDVVLGSAVMHAPGPTEFELQQHGHKHAA